MLGAPGAGAAPGVEGPAGAGASAGRGALQNGQTTGRKFGETIFLPHSGQISGPEVVSGGLKHMSVSSFRTTANGFLHPYRCSYGMKKETNPQRTKNGGALN